MNCRQPPVNIPGISCNVYLCEYSVGRGFTLVFSCSYFFADNVPVRTQFARMLRGVPCFFFILISSQFSQDCIFTYVLLVVTYYMNGLF